MTITVFKHDHAGREILRYDGSILARGVTWVQLEARFSRADVQTAYHTFRRGDRFVEWFYSDRWYNIFEMYDRDNNRFTGWYCNVTRPAVITAHEIHADDLALDIFVAPDGAITVLDEDEFAALPLDATTRAQARAALSELLQCATERQPPFDRK